MTAGALYASGRRLDGLVHHGHGSIEVVSAPNMALAGRFKARLDNAILFRASDPH